MMDANAVGALIAIGGFVVAFGVAKWVSTRIRQKHQAITKAVTSTLKRIQWPSQKECKRCWPLWIKLATGMNALNRAVSINISTAAFDG